MSHRPLVGVLILSLALGVAKAEAQTDFDRVIGVDEYDRPLVLRTVDSLTLGVFARAAGVPMGLELAPGASGPKRNPVTLTGLTVSKALQVIAAFDERYEMREVEGVFVLRTREAWERPDHPLHASVPPILLPNIRLDNALSLVAAFLGAPQYRGGGNVGDLKRLSLNLPAGTVLDLLNGTVRAHGEMAWAFESAAPGRSSLFPYTVTLHAAGGYGVPGVPSGPVDVSLYADRSLLAAGTSPAVLERIVGRTADGRPVVVNGPYPSAIHQLATATKVPMGIEFLGPRDPALTGSITATGRTLRDVLDAIVAVDPQYEWREMHGVIVVRPAAAWRDPDNLLFRLVPPVQLTEVLPGEAVGRVARELGHPSPLTMPRGALISLNQPQGTLLDLVNALIRAHGEMMWDLTPETDPATIQQGYRHTLTFFVMGGSGTGFAVR